MENYEEPPTRGAHPVARKYAGVLARGLRPRVLRTAGYTPGGRRREPGRGAIFEGVGGHGAGGDQGGFALDRPLTTPDV